MSCPDRLSQWSQQVSIAFAHLSKPQVWGLVLWSVGIALSGAAGITQISASRRVGIGPARTSGVSTLARVVSGCQTQKWEKAPRSGCNLLLCPIVALDRADDGEMRTGSWCWYWMLQPWASVGRFCRSVLSFATARSQWR